MKTSQTGIDLIKKYEGCRLTAYLCPANVWTIGYGHTAGVQKGQTITQAQAEKFLVEDLAKFETRVNKYYPAYTWNQNEFDALVSFAYNIGSIDQLTTNGTRNRTTIAEKIVLYTKAGDKVLTGLVRRREEEQALFLLGKSEEIKMGINTYSKNRDGNTNIAANFKVKEFACRDGSDAIIIDSETVHYLQQARDHFGIPITINSGYRTEAYNKKVGGATNSYHVKGQAVDHHTGGKVALLEMAKFYENIGCKGIIVYAKSGFIHIDSRTSKYFSINDGTAKSVSTFGTSQAATADRTIVALQTVIGAKSDGIPGKETLSKCPTLRRNDRSDVVAWLQAKLGITADGIFGINTLNAIFKFQRENGLLVDGVFGQRSWRKILGL